MTCPLVARRTEDGLIMVSTSAHLSHRPGSWKMTGAEAKRLAAQILAATVEDETFQEGTRVGADAWSLVTRIRKLAGG